MLPHIKLGHFEFCDIKVPYIRKEEAHYHCKAATHVGRAPPFPPVGAQIFINDEADNINSKCLQTPIDFSIY